LFVPLILSILLTCFDILIVKEIANTLLTILSISVPLLFSLLVLLYDINQNILDKNAMKDKIEVNKQTFHNVSFLIFLSLVIVLIISIYILIEQKFGIYPMKNYIWLMKFFSIIIYYCLGVFLLTFFMILKRTHILIDSGFNQ